MYSLAMASPVFKKAKDKENEALQDAAHVMEFFQEGLPDMLQIGGNASLGKGMVRAHSFSFSTTK